MSKENPETDEELIAALEELGGEVKGFFGRMIKVVDTEISHFQRIIGAEDEKNDEDSDEPPIRESKANPEVKPKAKPKAVRKTVRKTKTVRKPRAKAKPKAKNAD